MKGLDGFRVARYEFVVEAVDNLFLPPYKGSTFRGGFGTAFRRIACSADRADCRDCMLKRPCPYAYIFETAPPDGSEALTKFQHVPHPFVLEPPLTERREFAPGDELTVGLVLIGRGIEFLPYFIAAFQEFGRMGIGRGRGRFRLKRVYASIGVPGEHCKSGGDEGRVPVAATASLGVAGRVTGMRDAHSCGARALVFDGKENKVYTQDAVVTWDDVQESAGRTLACLRLADGQGPAGGRPSGAYESAALSSSVSAASSDSRDPSACSVCFDWGDASVPSHSAGRVGSAGCPLVPRVTVAFRTMTRLRFQGGLEDRPEFHVLIRSLLRRVSSLLYFHHGTRLDMDFRGFISRAETVRLADLNTRWVDWERYSSRQDTRMKLGGLVGIATYEFGDARLAESFLPWLVLGEYVHVGKGCTFGLGCFAVALCLQ